VTPWGTFYESSNTIEKEIVQHGMRLYNLGKVPWMESQLIYHALAEMGREALSLVSPASPYVCIGFHQDVEQEVDLAYCRAKNIPVFRRDLGGGAVYLDGDQLFFTLFSTRTTPRRPRARKPFTGNFLNPSSRCIAESAFPPNTSR
jgi:lipoate---protein ligase